MPGNANHWPVIQGWVQKNSPFKSCLGLSGVLGVLHVYSLMPKFG